MTLSTWSCNSRGTLIGCGVDVESIERFVPVASGVDYPMPFVFTQRELAHARRQEEPARVLCVAFSCKEALLKALSTPYDFTECETFPEFDAQKAVAECPVHLTLSSAAPKARVAASMRSMPNPINDNEMITSVYLFQEAGS